MKMLEPIFVLGIFAAKSFGQDFPKCWTHFGECLDNNEPPLNLTSRVKPLNNENVIRSIMNVNSIEDCSSDCESEKECNFFTLYKSDPNKNCHLVGFNLGNSCKRLANVCILHKSCGTFNESCGLGCITGRRFIQDNSSEFRTLIIGGVKDKRLSSDEYETSIEVLDSIGESECKHQLKTGKREGAAGGFLSSKDVAIMCGGWQTADISLSNTKTGYIKGNYLNTCEWIKKGLKWEESSATMIKHRAFFSMAATENAIFAFGGYNNYQGMLEYIEKFDGTSWTELTTTKLAEPKSHTCATSFRYNDKTMIFVFGGWSQNLDFVSVVEVFEVDLAGDLVLNMKYDLPADRADDESRTKGKSDMGCIQYRRNGWEDGILMTGGYREAGAWLNTAWWLNLTILFDTNTTLPAWERITNISPEFDKGRHFHQMTTANFRPLMVGGWRNLAEDSTLMLDECEEDDDLTRPGVWKTHGKRKLRVGREKFVGISVPKDFLIGSDLACA